MGKLPQRNSVHRVWILVLFIDLAERAQSKVRKLYNTKVNEIIHWGMG
jgi:hypothetical protein